MDQKQCERESTKMFSYHQTYPNYVYPMYMVDNLYAFTTYPFLQNMTNNSKSINCFYQNQYYNLQTISREQQMVVDDNQELNKKNLVLQQKQNEFEQQKFKNKSYSTFNINSTQHEITQKNQNIDTEKQKTKQLKKKTTHQKKDKAYVAKQYPKKEPSINSRYIQKNFELNIINQVFSFTWSDQKSAKYVNRFFNNQNIKVSLFYEYIKTVRKFSKRYINKQYLKNLCDYQNHHIAYKMVARNTQKLQYLTMKQFSQCVKYLIYLYLNQLCPLAIVTSKKMRRQIWGQHLNKCRLLKQFMFYELQADQYQKLLIRQPNDQIIKNPKNNQNQQ